MSIQKKPYEISVWEDVIVYVGTPSGNEYSSIADMSGTGDTVKYQYYTERELAIIGSSTMTSPARTINNVLKKNINGVETLTFDMYYQYEDIEEGKIIHNPLIDLVIDERKVKLHYDNKWYDFIVKKDDEKGRDYKYSFTCTGLAANELGKTGFNIELDTELENNTGTIWELADAVLEGSDWQTIKDNQEVIQQTNDEALYLIQLNSQITGTVVSSDTTKTINSGSWIYVYYTSYINQVENYFQFIYVDKSNGLGTPDLYEDKITIYCNNTSGGTYDLYINNVTWSDGKPSFEQSSTKTVADYRGRRYVRKQLMDYDPVLEQTVYKYKGNLDNKDYYEYTTTEFLDATSVTNYIYNSTNFSGTSYWTGYNNTSIDARVYPDVNPQNANTTEFNQYLIVNLNFKLVEITETQFNNNKTGYWRKQGDNYVQCTNNEDYSNISYYIQGRVINDGILQNYSRINSFEKGEYYRFKIWVGEKDDNSGNIVAGSIPFKCIVKKYVTIDEDTDNDVIYFTFNAAGTQVSNTGYYYVDAQCANSATWEDLSSNVGIFLYPRTNSNININYYIKDIQLYRRISNNNGGYLDIGDVPEVRVITHYHFYDPSINLGKTSAEDYVFADNNKDNYTPQYGSGVNEFEKVRSITAKESNRFNLLQELSETFECWVRFEIEHEINGQIKVVEYDYYESQPNLTQQQFNANKANYYLYSQYDKVYVQCTNEDTFDSKKIYYTTSKRMRQSKNVVFYGEILQDNYVGFKYGINLKDNNRTLDSEQIVTKIIVKDNTCEAAENGFCSIARAQDNPIKENFALNLDYYVTQGLINSSNLNNDLYLELNKSIGLYPKLSRYNKERNSLIETQALEANSINRLTSDYQAAQLTYNEAAKALSKLLDPVSGTIVQYTGYQYEDFSNQYTRTSNHNNVPAYKNEVYFIKVALPQLPSDNSDNMTYYAKPTESQPGDIDYYILENNHFKNIGRITKFSTTQTYFKIIAPRYTENTYFQTSNTTTSINFGGNSNSSEVYIYAAARRVMEVDTSDCINDSYMISKMAEVVTLQNQKDTAEVNMNKAKTDLDNVQADYDSIKSRLSDIAKATEEIEKDFNTKYSRYIQEGSWTDDNYMDDDLYYFDALDVLYQSAYPKVSYNFKVLELSQLEGYEAFKFDIGHKTFVEDTEFFGYWLVNGLKTPVKETVVVTEATLNLDEPDKNDLKVQNYKSHFEDLFQRITAATQSLEYHSGEYGRAAAAMTPEGTVSETVLQKSFATAAYIIQNSRDQSVVWDDTGIQATNLNDPAQVTRLASGGLLVSSDGGQTWGVAISGYGINANYLNVGTIDVDKINIMSGAYPTFKWDALGLRAYAFETDNGVIRSYDPTRYVAHDRFGIYGLNGYLTPPDLNTVQQVEENANFALTWNGLFIKTSHRDGYIRISPTEDITLHSTLNNTDVIRGKFGLLGENSSGEEIYGLALYGPELDENNKPIPTVETKSDGTLWLKSQMDIGTSGQGNTIYIGVGEEDTLNPNRYKVIKVNDLQNNEKFIVYSDGTLKASGAIIEGSGTFTGTINANGGHIGNMTIAGLVDTVGIRISPSTGTFKVNGSTATPSSITFELKSGLEGVTSYTWHYGPNPNSWIGTYVGSSFVLNYNSSLFNSGITYVQASTTVNGTTYSDRVTISEVEDGENGKDTNQYTIRTVAEEILKFPNQSEWEDKKYLFSISNFQMLGFDSKNQVPIGNTEYTSVPNLTPEEFNSNKTYYYTKNQSGKFVQCTNSDTFNLSTDYYYKSPLYCVLDVEVEGYKFKELFKPDDGNNLIYSRYVYTQGSDTSNYYFSIINFYNDLLDNTLSSNFSDKKYQSVIITANDFDGHQTDYYTYDETQEEYIQCQPNETFDSTKTYYVDYSNEIINTFLDCFENVNGFDFRIYGQVIDLDGNTSNIEKFIGVKNGLNSEMLDFSVTAGGVYAAIQGKKLTFDGEGLTVLNNGFKIEVGEEDQDKTTIFSVDPLSQQLIMNGSGTFTGTINADSGSFKGSIDAASGAIGGFLINNNSIVSKTQKLQLYSQMDLDLGVIEQGTISSTTYGNSNNSTRVRTQGYVSVLPGHSYIFTVDDNYQIIEIDEATFNSSKTSYYTFDDEQNIYEQCDSSSVFSSSTIYYIARQLLIRGYSGTSPETHVSQAYVGWTNFPFTYEVPESTNYIRLVIRKSNNSNITPNEIQNLQGYEDISLINAGNIHIGDGGVIDGYLRIGNLSLMNPSKTNENIVMNLQVPGENSYFKLTNNGYIEGQNWSIKKETGNPYVVARFGKLVAEDGQFSGVIYATDGSFSGAITASTINATTLNTVNFVTENTRSMGGSFIFKPTFQIVDFEDKSDNTLEFELENTGDYFNFDSFETEDEVELSGKNISFNNNIGEIKSFELEFEPVQNYNGYDQPWATGAGKNKVPVSMTSNNYTDFGINVIVNDDGTFTTTGSNTGTATLSASSNPIFTASNIADKLVDGQTYFLSGCPAGGSSSTYRVTLRKTTNGTSTYVTDSGSGASFTYDAASTYLVYININETVDVDGFVWKPMICLDSEMDKTWAPYSNVCPITGWTGARIYKSGKNLYCADDRSNSSRGVTFTYYDDGSVQVNGTATGGDSLNGSTWSSKTDAVKRRYPVLPAGDYIISDGVGDSAVAHLWCQFFKADGSATQSVTINGTSKTSASIYNDTLISSSVPFIAQIRIIVSSGKTSDNEILYPMIRSASTSADFEPPATKYTVDWTSTAGTVYTGSLDMVNRKLMVNCAVADENYFTDISSGPISGGGQYYVSANEVGNKLNGFGLCNMLLVNNDEAWQSTSPVAQVSPSEDELRIYGSFTTLAEFKTQYSGLQFIYELATPIEYNLTLQEIEFFTGKNNIWTNNGTIQLIYNNKQIIVTLSGIDSSTSLSNVRFGKVSSIANINENKVQVKFTNEDYQILNNPNLLDNYQTLTLFGESYNDLIIGINSDNNSAGNILPPRALVMRSFTNDFNEQESGIINYNTKLLLGDLSSLVNQDSSYKYLSGYGLYADNVFLHGSLMTRNGEGSFAGINTSKNYDFNYAEWGGSNENIYPNEKIIFWGGANDLSDESIRRSPFIVTDKGSIFANRGEFKGTVITDSTIANSIIKTPIIYGIGNDPSLKIYNTYNESGGIGFYKTTNDTIGDLDDKQTLNISNLGFTHYIGDTNNNRAFKFIEFADGSNSVRFYGYSLAAYDINSDGTINNSSYTVYRNKNIENGTTSIKIDKDTGVELNYNDNRKITIDNQGIFNTGGSVTNEGATIFQGAGTDSNKQIKHAINSNGYYCVYVVR